MAGAMALRTRFRVCYVTAFRAMRIGARDCGAGASGTRQCSEVPKYARLTIWDRRSS
jgi:hypothetical protein